jgi:hypothetical protein
MVVLAILVAGCGDGPVSREVGARCDQVQDCDQRCLPPTEDDYPGGFCTIACDGDDDCPGAAVCADVEGGVCLFSCAIEPDCDFLGAGWICQETEALPEGTVSVCLGD